jgi:signal transduction histidine kinase
MDARVTNPEDVESAGAPAAHGVRFGLGGRLVALVIIFVMLSEVAVYVPSIANFRNSWLRDRLSAASTAALVFEASPIEMVPPNLAAAILDSVGAKTIVLKMSDNRRLLAASDMPPRIDESFDLRAPSPWTSIAAAFRSLAANDGRILQVVGDAPMGAQFMEITLDETPLRRAMFTYSTNILLLSLVISGVVAALALLALHLMVLRPVRRLTSSITAFGAEPENATLIIEPSGRAHEIGVAEDALALMQRSLVRELSQAKHLAALGLAVAKINHDLRNILASAQLLSDRMAELSRRDWSRRSTGRSPIVSPR